MVKELLEPVPAVFVAVTVKGPKVPATADEPVITPVALVRVTPVGNAGDMVELTTALPELVGVKVNVAPVAYVLEA